MTTAPPVIKFSNEESKSAIRSKVSQNLHNIVELTRATIKSSETHDLFKHSIKQFTQNDPLIENSTDKLKKIDIITSQVNYQIETIRTDCLLLDEISQQIDAIRKPL